jgi:hypothetical protein
MKIPFSPFIIYINEKNEITVTSKITLVVQVQQLQHLQPYHNLFVDVAMSVKQQ